MKHIFILLTIIFAFNLLNAQETHRFRTDVPQGLNIESSTATGLSLHYVLNEITIANAQYDKARGQEIIMKGSFGSFAEGLPNLPFENRYIAVPRGAKVSVKVKENGHKTLKDIDLLPAAKVMLNQDSRLPELRKDRKVYAVDANFPSENVTIAETTQIRGLDVVMLNVTPFRYNPVRKTLEVVYDMDIEVSFEGGNGEFGDARYRNPDWDHLLRDLVINSDMLPESHYYERLNDAIQNREEGCEYLIITLDDPTYMAWADTLKQFRTKQGMPKLDSTPFPPILGLRKIVIHASALHHDGIMYGIRISAESSPFAGISVRTISHAISAPSGTEMTVTSAPMISELRSGTHRIVLVSGLARRYFQYQSV